MGMTRFHGRTLVDGSATGSALVADVPLSFWGGVDPETGTIIDRRHPLEGRRASGRILVLPAGRGSCSASGVLLESIANGVAPAGIVVSELDPVIGLGAILGEELLGRTVPVVLVSVEERRAIENGAMVRILPGGTIEVDSGASPPES